jgi:CBS domain-containing protein
MVALLHGSGIRIERIARLVGELNRHLFARTWALVAPPELVAGSCLLVMGSEGRGEQILKTDQDNALLLRDGFDCRAWTPWPRASTTHSPSSATRPARAASC